MEHPFKLKPFNHQREELFSHGLDSQRAIFWEQGTGKSKLTIDTACMLWLAKKINGVVVIAPNGVHRNWIEEELPAHLPDEVADDTKAVLYSSDKASTKWHQQMVRDITNYRGFAWLVISYDGL